MRMANIDLFDEFTARALAVLYESFPRKCVLDARQLAGHLATDDYGGVLDDEGRPSLRFEIAKATIEWLTDTGYIRANGVTPWGLREAVLTPAGLVVLKASPESLKATETIGERIARFTREGSIELAREAAKAAISAGVGMVVR